MASPKVDVRTVRVLIAVVKDQIKRLWYLEATVDIVSYPRPPLNGTPRSVLYDSPPPRR